MTVIEDQDREPDSARETINQMLDAGLLDGVMDRIDAGGLALTGEGGFLPEMIKAVLERGPPLATRNSLTRSHPTAGA